jgi:hypothetical protein
MRNLSKHGELLGTPLEKGQGNDTAHALDDGGNS